MPVAGRTEECERGALRVADPLVRASYVEMARRWREMADRTQAMVPVTASRARTCPSKPPPIQEVAFAPHLA